MIAVDTNVLVYAHRRDAPAHERAVATVGALAEGAERWAVPWPCVGEFYSVVTSGRGLAEPTAPRDAVDQLDAWLASPSVVLLGESGNTWRHLRGLLLDTAPRGARVHDARIAAVCLDAGVAELWTADRDFSRFPALRTRNPLVDSAL